MAMNEGGTRIWLSSDMVCILADEDKLALLRQLAATDFLAAPWHKVPPNVSSTNPDGERMKSIAHASMLSDPPAGRAIEVAVRMSTKTVGKTMHS